MDLGGGMTVRSVSGRTKDPGGEWEPPPCIERIPCGGRHDCIVIHVVVRVALRELGHFRRKSVIGSTSRFHEARVGVSFREDSRAFGRIEPRIWPLQPSFLQLER
jgi:hypothetical protein